MDQHRQAARALIETRRTLRALKDQLAGDGCRAVGGRLAKVMLQVGEIRAALEDVMFKAHSKDAACTLEVYFRRSAVGDEVHDEPS